MAHPATLLAVALCCASLCASQSTVDGPTTSKTIIIQEMDPHLKVRKAWMDLDKDLRGAMGKVIKSLMPTVMREVYSRNVSSSCLTGLLQTVGALRKGKLWPFQMLDACGKLPEGFLMGSLTMLGNYKECVEIDVDDKKAKLRGQYCSVQIEPPVPLWRPFMSLHLRLPELENVSEPDSVISHITGFVHNLHVTTIKMGLCVPSTCSRDDINNLAQILPEKTGIPWNFSVTRCETKEPLTFESDQTGFLYVFGFISLLVFLGTLLDIIFAEESLPQKNAKGAALQVLRAFSFPANARKLANHVCPEERLRFVYGMMFFALLWIIISNTFMYVNYEVIANLLGAFQITKNLFYEIVLGRVYPTQAFFYLNGFIGAYNILKSPETNMCVWKYLLKRYWRYTPTYILMIMFIMMTPTWGSGPTWHDQMDPIYENCRRSWWANIFYFNNFIDSETMCLDHTWMLSVDAQLHIIGIFVLIILKRRPKIGLMLNFVLLGASLLTVALTNVYFELPPNEMMAVLIPKDRMFYANHTYFRAYTHLCNYCTGIAVGYYMARYPKFQMSRRTTWLLGTVAVAAGLATLTSVHEWRTGVVPSPMASALYASLGKLAWSGLLAWMTVACMAGSGGAMNDVLSWGAFSFFSRLIFIAYLLNPVIVKCVMAFRKSHLFVEELEILYIIVAHFGGTFLVAYACYIGFEAPLISLTEIIRRTVRSRPFNSRVKYPVNSCVVVVSEKPMRYQDTKSAEQTKTKF